MLIFHLCWIFSNISIELRFKIRIDIFFLSHPYLCFRRPNIYPSYRGRVCLNISNIAADARDWKTFNYHMETIKVYFSSIYSLKKYPIYQCCLRSQPRTTVSQDMQTWFSVQLAFAKFLYIYIYIYIYIKEFFNTVTDWQYHGYSTHSEILFYFR